MPLVNDAPQLSVRRGPAPRGIADRIGMTGSIVCAVHCALLPLVFAALPTVGLGVLASWGFELGFVLFATALAIGSLAWGYRRHGRYRAWMFLLPGLLMLWTAVWYPALHHAAIPHAVAMTLGGTVIAVAHLFNLRLSHAHVHDASCQH